MAAAPIGRLLGAYWAPINRQASTGPHPAPISDRQTTKTRKSKKNTKNTLKIHQILVYFLCFFCVFCFSDAPDGRTDGRPGHTYLSEARAGVYHAPGAYHGA
jgi:hypothetical protein